MKKHEVTCTIKVIEEGTTIHSSIELGGDSNGSMLAYLIVQLLNALDEARKQLQKRSEPDSNNKA